MTDSNYPRDSDHCHDSDSIEELDEECSLWDYVCVGLVLLGIVTGVIVAGHFLVLVGKWLWSLL